MLLPADPVGHNNSSRSWAAPEKSASSKRETCLLHQRILGLLLLLVQESHSIGVRPIW
jgi:hypothetical protein